MLLLKVIDRLLVVIEHISDALQLILERVTEEGIIMDRMYPLLIVIDEFMLIVYDVD